MEAKHEFEAAVPEGTEVLLVERLQMRGAPFFPLPPVEGEKRRISEAHAKVDSYMYMKRQMSAPDIHQTAEGGSRPGSGHGRPGSGCVRPGSGRGRPRSGRGLHTPGGGNIKIFSTQLPDFSHVKSRIDSSPPRPKESVESQQRPRSCSASLQARTSLGSLHSKFLDHSHSKDSVTSPLRENSWGEVASALTRRNKSTSELRGRQKSIADLRGRNKSMAELSGRARSKSEVSGMNNSTPRLTGRNMRLTGGRRPLGTRNRGREDTSEEGRKHSTERLGHHTGLLAPPQSRAPLTQSDTTVVQELNAIRRLARPKVDAGNPLPSSQDLFCSIAELTDRESFSVNVRFLLRPQLVAAIFKRRRSFSEIDASATLDRRKDVNSFSLKRSKSLSDLFAIMSADDRLAPGRAATLPSMQQSQGTEGEGCIPFCFSGKVSVEGSGSEGTDSEKEEVDLAKRKVGGSHMWDCHGDEAGNCPHQSAGVQSWQPAVPNDGGQCVQTTPTKRTKADKSAVNCKRNPQQQKMALPLSLRRYMYT